MNELWVPKSDEQPDLTNLFDMMLVFQEAIDRAESEEGKILQTQIAGRALAVCFYDFTKDDPTVSVSAELAVFERSPDAQEGALATKIGLRGRIDSLRSFQAGGQVPFGISLGMDVESVFPLDAPDVNDIVLCRARVPINRVHAIERLAS